MLLRTCSHKDDTFNHMHQPSDGSDIPHNRNGYAVYCTIDTICRSPGSHLSIFTPFLYRLSYFQIDLKWIMHGIALGCMLLGACKWTACVNYKSVMHSHPFMSNMNRSNRLYC